ncbi:MAG: hypothetical protein IPG22_07135 [Acidobacteria bacterium]|nr:hypothetical protein [Acidobacteriota bacterium]
MERRKEFIGHRIAKERFEPVEAILYEYLLAGNGVLLRAQRVEFTVSVPLMFREIKGLPAANVGIKWHKPKVPNRIWDEICKHAQISNSNEKFREELYLVYWDSERYAWQWCTSSKDRTHTSTIADDRRPEYSRPVSRFIRTQMGHTSLVPQMTATNRESSASSESLQTSTINQRSDSAAGSTITLSQFHFPGSDTCQAELSI